MKQSSEKVLKQKKLTAFFRPLHLTATAQKIDSYDRQIAASQVKIFHKAHPKHIYDKSHSWKGYSFIATNNFREYSVKTMTARNHRDLDFLIPAGFTVANATVDDDSALTHLEVHQLFQRLGIGRELLRFIKNSDKQFIIYGGTSNNSRYRLTAEGAGVGQKAFKKKNFNH